MNDEERVEEIKRTAIGIINAALSARELPRDERIEQYRSDYMLLVSDITTEDLFYVGSLMGDVAAALICTISLDNEVEPERAMTWLADEIMSTAASSGDEE